MPNKIKVTKEDILKVSLDIVDREGLEAVNARRIANELKCSIQPVYYYFSTMDTLRMEIKESVKLVYNSFIEESKNEDTANHFKAVGIAYIKFAEKKPNFFKLLFMDNDDLAFGLNENLDSNYNYIVQTIIDEYNISKEEALDLYECLWVTTHGLAVMIATGFMHPSSDKIARILNNTMRGQLMLIKGKK